MEKLLTLNEVAHRLAVHPNTVRRMVITGELQAIRISRRGDMRFRQTALEDYMVKRQTPLSA